MLASINDDSDAIPAMMSVSRLRRICEQMVLVEGLGSPSTLAKARRREGGSNSHKARRRTAKINHHSGDVLRQTQPSPWV